MQDIYTTTSHDFCTQGTTVAVTALWAYKQTHWEWGDLQNVVYYAYRLQHKVLSEKPKGCNIATKTYYT